jgi:hypothetical protein
MNADKGWLMPIQAQLKDSQNMLIFALSLIFVAAFSRLIPHAPNFTAVTAIALFAGVRMTNRGLAVLVPLAALGLSDWALGFYDGMLLNYLPMILVALFSFQLLKRKNLERDSLSLRDLGLASLAASLFFFVVSNFGVWLLSGMYTRTAQGLLACYVMALPFLQNQICGDLFFSAILFGAYAFAKHSIFDSSRAL